MYYSYQMMWPTQDDQVLRSDIIALIKYECVCVVYAYVRNLYMYVYM